MKQPIQILLVDDHEVVRMGLKTLFSRYPSLKVIAEAANGEDAVKIVSLHRPDVVIMDLRLPGESGVEAIRAISEQFPEVQILVLTAFSEEQLVVDAIAAGAKGYLLKEMGTQRLVEAIEAVARGDAFLDPRVTERVLKKVRESRTAHEPFASLSFQERRILTLIAEGKTNREIGDRLGLSEKTVRNYVSTMLGKLGLHSRTQAAALAIRHRSGLPPGPHDQDP